MEQLEGIREGELEAMRSEQREGIAEGLSAETMNRDQPRAPSDFHTPLIWRGSGRESERGSNGTGGRVKPRVYDGTGSWKEYKSQFDRVGLINGWEEKDKLDYLWINLAGTALSFVEGLPEAQRVSYQTVSDAMEKRFGAENMAMLFKAELLHNSRKRGQSLYELGQEVRRLTDNAYPNFPAAAREEMAIEKMVEALPNTAQRLHIYQANPRTLEEAMEIGARYEAWITADGKTHSKLRATVTEEVEIKESAQMEELLDRVRKIEMGEKSRKENKEIRCFYCDKVGHISRDCRRRMREQAATVCYNCKEKGHFARNCNKAGAQGNE